MSVDGGALLTYCWLCHKLCGFGHILQL
eukprot:COSAG01_NODE_53167_length_341_cov_0.644628_1_plen_27_part_10